MRNILILLTLVLVACGPDSKHYAIDGRLLNLNQGEFIVYSPDGAMESVDTIYIQGGRFDYEGSCAHKGTAVVIFPNGQEVPVFIAPGKTYTINGDAQNLKALKVEGGDENKLMNGYRKAIEQKDKNASFKKEVQDVVEKAPESIVSRYLVKKYLIDSPTPDYDTALKLIDVMSKANNDDAALTILKKRITQLKSSAKGNRIPSFSITDINGKNLSNGIMSKGVWIVCSIAAWDFDSTNQLRRIRSVKQDKKADWNILAVSFDPSKKRCEETLRYDKSDFTIVCDEKMSETLLAEKFSLQRTAQIVIIKDGIIKERDLVGEDIYTYLKEKVN